MLTAIVAYGPSSLPLGFPEQMFPGLIQLAWRVQDIDELQSTAKDGEMSFGWYVVVMNCVL